MEYKRLQDCIVVRMDVGDEILACLMAVCQKERVQLATISGLGAVNEVELGLFDPAEKQYYGNQFARNMEVVSFAGNVTTLDGEVYLHCHMSVADAEGAVVGGHLKRAVISATGEFFILPLSGSVQRRFSDEVGLNLLAF